MFRTGLVLGVVVVSFTVLGAVLRAQPQSFDMLSKADRLAFQQRFTREIWPLMQRNGKEGCVGCHSGKIVTSLHLTGDANKDFPKMLRDGFFLPDDAGSLLGRITDKDPGRKMPRSKTMPWNDSEIRLLATFVADLDKKQRR